MRLSDTCTIPPWAAPSKGLCNNGEKNSVSCFYGTKHKPSIHQFQRSTRQIRAQCVGRKDAESPGFLGSTMRTKSGHQNAFEVAALQNFGQINRPCIAADSKSRWSRK